MHHVLLASAAVAILLCAGATHANTPEQTVPIGNAGPLSGSIAHYGRDVRNAAMMAIDDLNARQPTIGGRRVRFVLVAEDDAANPRQGVVVAQKLCDMRVAGVVGHIHSGTAIPAARIYEDCGIPFLSSGATNPRLTQLGYRTTYRMLANDDALAKAVALHAANVLGLRRIAVVDDRTAYGQGVSEIFKREARAAGIEIVAEEFTTDKAVDFSAILTTIKSRNPDAIFFGGSDAQGGPMLRQLDRFGMSSIPLLGGDGICTAQMGALAAEARSLAGVVCAEGGASIAKMPGGLAWKQRYDARFPGEYALFSPYTYDGVMVLADAMRRADSTDPAVYATHLAATDYRGVTTRVRFNGSGDLQDPAITLYTFREGVKTPLE